MTIIKSKNELVKFCKENGIEYTTWHDGSVSIRTIKDNTWKTICNDQTVEFDNDGFIIRREYNIYCQQEKTVLKV